MGLFIREFSMRVNNSSSERFQTPGFQWERNMDENKVRGEVEIA